ncbi:alpha/beta hydrolase [Streptococcus caprae]|uniref:Alpha/beta hydrolase n=1 Tax=Streptococcus caprae TaxID=1640501 RepID=A0ABV8CSV7_9STRE
MAIMHIEYNSEALNQYRQVTVLYPDASHVTEQEAVDTDIPVLYLLHGMNGNENSWTGRTNLERLVRYTNLIVVMPNCDNGWYTNTASGLNYFDAIAIELPQVIRRFFPNMTTKREKTFIAGLSMGGYGAFKIALETNQFSWAGSFSGALVEEEEFMDLILDDQTYWKGIFGELDPGNLKQHYLTTSAQKFDGQTQFYAWCGEGDFLYNASLHAVEKLRAAELDLTFTSSPGTHEWYYWEKQIEVFLEMLPIEYKKEERLS